MLLLDELLGDLFLLFLCLLYLLVDLLLAVGHEHFAELLLLLLQVTLDLVVLNLLVSLRQDLFLNLLGSLGWLFGGSGSLLARALLSFGDIFFLL